MTASLVQLKADVTTLQREFLQTQVRQVAFSASLLDGGQAANVGPFPSPPTLVFQNFITNIGNAYNSTSGVFTAPVRGAYNFEWTVGAYADGSHASAAWLVRNSDQVFIAYEYQTAGFMSSSKAVTLLLKVGDTVSVHLATNTLAFDNENHHNTFSGFLLFPM
ncbi:hypothetical protein PFLUV_G00185980 [Perca fluviatilis]|uniref:C1q domain-containing protein n=1 Tax=Perca fluviatilis TaxID=8168 RepID=A0A6A5EGD0_PERFL|nr:complement C1q tumor necrosis factor-related protein 3-like [Perca fluviatilis]KAF1378085.1 hypothetical protein PFLUV_G00185980 [Perca fluviatilis]